MFWVQKAKTYYFNFLLWIVIWSFSNMLFFPLFFFLFTLYFFVSKYLLYSEKRSKTLSRGLHWQTNLRNEYKNSPSAFQETEQKWSTRLKDRIIFFCAPNTSICTAGGTKRLRHSNWKKWKIKGRYRNFLSNFFSFCSFFIYLFFSFNEVICTYTN